MKKRFKECLVSCAVLAFLGTTTALTAQPAPEQRKASPDIDSGSSGEPTVNAKVYGFIKTDYIHATNAATTFGVGENLLAPTTAKRQVQFDDSHARSQISANQSRFGIAPSVGEKLTGKIEMDFVGGYSASQPNTSTVVRMRQAYLDYDMTDSFGIFAGQKWDIFAPLNPSTYNVTGVLLTEGNIGWIREQIGADFTLADGMVVKAAIGNTTNNGSPDPILSHELNGLPTFAVNWTYDINKSVMLTASGIYTDVKYAQPLIDPTVRQGDLLNQDIIGATFATMQSALQGNTAAQQSLFVANYESNKIRKRTSSGVSAGGKFGLGDKLTLSTELYYGQNLGNIRTLALGKVQTEQVSSQVQDQIYGYITDSGNATFNAILADARSATGLLGQKTDYTSIKELGGWLMVQFDLNKSYTVKAFGSMAKVLNKEDLVATATVADLAYAQGTSGSNMNPIFENGALGWSFTWNAYKNLAFYFEHKHLITRYYDSERLTTYRYIDVASGGIDIPNNTVALNTTGMVMDSLIAPAETSTNVYRAGAMMKF